MPARPRPPSAQSPFARRLSPSGRPQGSPRRALPLHPRSYGLTRQTLSLSGPSSSPVSPESWQVVASPCWDPALPDIVSATLAWVLGPFTPPSPSGACPVLPQGPRPRVTVTTLGGQNYPCHATSTGNRISGRQSFASLQAPTLARPPDCADRNTSRCWAAGPFTPRIAWPVTRSRMWHRYMSVLGD